MKRALPLAAVCVACAFTWQGVAADPTEAETKRRSAVVATVGSWTITVGELEDQIERIPPFQRVALGKTPDAIRRTLLNDVVIPNALYAAYAESHHLADASPYREAMMRGLANATLRAIRKPLGTPASVTKAEVSEYYAAHRAEYDIPERYAIWRILVATRDDAVQVLNAIAKEPTPQVWMALARDHSLDKATYLRGGNVGFVTQSGVSSEPGLRIDQAVVKAIAGLKDGEFAKAPVEEGGFFAVVWRRGTLPAVTKSLDTLAPTIREKIWSRRVEQQQEEHVAALRAEKVRDVDVDRLLTLDFPPPP